MPVRTIKAALKRAERLDSLVREVTETASDLLAHSDRVLVVYEKGAASLYYEVAPELKRLPPPS